MNLTKKIMMIILGITLVGFTPINAKEDTVSVSSVEQLNDELASVNTTIGQTKTIVITKDLTLTTPLSIPLNTNKNITLKGDNMITLKNVNTSIFNVNNGAATFRVESIKLQGSIKDDQLTDGLVDWDKLGGINNTTAFGGDVYNGNLELDNVIFTRFNDNAFVRPYKSIVMNNTSFVSNYAATNAAAIELANGAGKLDITNSTFYDNSASNGTNYSGGAIYISGGQEPVTIRNTVFKENRFSGYGGTNSGGGAIATNGSVRNVTIDSSYFDGNKVLTPATATAQKVSDGGAIEIKKSTGTHIISNSTFTKNVAFDEGGAISVVTSDNPDNKILNSTFIGNVAQGLQNYDGSDSGGAIELNGNSSTKTFMTLESNTIVNNEAQKGNASSNNYGGGVSLYYANAIFNNNLIVGNKSTSTQYDNVFVGASSTQNGITGSSTLIDNGKNLFDVAVEDVFGEYPLKLVNQNNISVGSTNSEYGTTLNTLPIKPEGLADDRGVSSLLLDQSGNKRDSSNSDFGSVEIKWIKYIANTDDSNWNLIKPSEFDGKTFFTQDNPIELYKIYPYESSVIVYSKPSEPNELRFESWNNKQDGLGDNYIENTSTIKIDVNKVLYGKWQTKTDKVTIKFDTQG